MPTSRLCEKCGAQNSPTARFCSQCGGPMSQGGHIAPLSAGFPAGSIQSILYPSLRDQRTKLIDRTKNGLIFLIAGLILSAIPVIQYLGVVVFLPGAILVFLGRSVFGREHSNYVKWAVVTYVIGFAVNLISYFWLTTSLAQTQATATDPVAFAEAASSSFYIFLTGLVAGAAILGLAYLLFAIALQRPVGRYLLWTGYGSALAINVLIAAFAASQVSDIIREAVLGPGFNSAVFEDFRTQVLELSLLGIAPSTMYSAAYYLAWLRIKRGELPETISEQRTATQSTGPLNPPPTPKLSF